MLMDLHPWLGTPGWSGGLGVTDADDNFFISYILLWAVGSPRSATEDIA